MFKQTKGFSEIIVDEIVAQSPYEYYVTKNWITTPGALHRGEAARGAWPISAAGMDKMSEGRVVIWISVLLFVLIKKSF